MWLGGLNDLTGRNGFRATSWDETFGWRISPSWAEGTEQGESNEIGSREQ
jgi:hypothetical protein